MNNVQLRVSLGVFALFERPKLKKVPFDLGKVIFGAKSCFYRQKVLFYARKCTVLQWYSIFTQLLKIEFKAELDQN